MAKMAPNGSEEVLGNTKTKTRVNASKKWCFTYNNYEESEIGEDGSIILRFKEKCNVFIIGLEIGDSGTPHMQGYCEFKEKLRPIESLKLNDKIHWEKARGSREENERYCSKENVLIKYGFPKEIKIIENLLEWQQDVINLIGTEPDGRKVHWYFDNAGGIGKSLLVKLLCYKYGAVMCAGKSADMKYMIVKYHEKNDRYPEIVIFDVPRSMKDYLSYSGIEEIKNGCFASSKYECDMVIMNAPHILVFANDEPEYDKLSKDRWVIHDLNPEVDDPE